MYIYRERMIRGLFIKKKQPLVSNVHSQFWAFARRRRDLRRRERFHNLGRWHSWEPLWLQCFHIWSYRFLISALNYQLSHVEPTWVFSTIINLLTQIKTYELKLNKPSFEFFCSETRIWSDEDANSTLYSTDFLSSRLDGGTLWTS